MPRDKLAEAMEDAAQLHQGQVDKSGEAYILHIMRVVLAMETEPERLVAAYHDTVEDSVMTIELLKELQGEEIATAVDVISHRDDEDYIDYIERVAKNDLARKVKIADLKDHLRAETAHFIDDSLRMRYTSALTLLESDKGGRTVAVVDN